MDNMHANTNSVVLTQTVAAHVLPLPTAERQDLPMLPPAKRPKIKKNH